MITLIAESKTMDRSLDEISIDNFIRHKPFFESEAQDIMTYLRTLPLSEISERLRISPSLAIKAAQDAQLFTDLTHGKQALMEYTGEVFKALDIKTLSENDCQFANDHTLIISSLYGMLTPENIIRPYRMDYSSDCGPQGIKLSSFWKSKNTIALVNLIKERKENEILNLMSGEAMKCIDFKVIKAFAKVEKPDFKTVSEMAQLKTPNTGRLKELRGLLLRHIISNRVDSFTDLMKISTAEFGVDSEHSKPGIPLILCND